MLVPISPQPGLILKPRTGVTFLFQNIFSFILSEYQKNYFEKMKGRDVIFDVDKTYNCYKITLKRGHT